VYHSYEAIFTASDIEDDPVAHFVSRWERAPQFIPVSESGSLYRPKPRFQRFLAIGVFRPELFERLL